MEKKKLTDNEFKSRISAFEEANYGSKLYITLYTVLLEIHADQTTFDQWRDACLIDDSPLQKLSVERMFELADSLDEWLETFSWAKSANLEEIASSVLIIISEIDDDNPIDYWIQVYEKNDFEDLRELVFQKIIGKELTHEQWLSFCEICDCVKGHIEYSLRQLYAAESTFKQWSCICSNGRYNGDIRQLGLRVVSEKECTFEELLDAHDDSDYIDDYRTIVMQRFSNFDASEKQWREAYVRGPYKDLGELADKKLIDIYAK